EWIGQADDGAEGFLEGMPDPDQLPAWLSQADVEFYAGQFARTGFRDDASLFGSTRPDCSGPEEENSPARLRPLDTAGAPGRGERQPERLPPIAGLVTSRSGLSLALRLNHVRGRDGGPSRRRSMAEVRRISADEAHEKVRAGQALLVCAYEDDVKCSR